MESRESWRAWRRGTALASFSFLTITPYLDLIFQQCRFYCHTGFVGQGEEALSRATGKLPPILLREQSGVWMPQGSPPTNLFSFTPQTTRAVTSGPIPMYSDKEGQAWVGANNKARLTASGGPAGPGRVMAASLSGGCWTGLCRERFQM